MLCRGGPIASLRSIFHKILVSVFERDDECIAWLYEEAVRCHLHSWDSVKEEQKLALCSKLALL